MKNLLTLVALLCATLLPSALLAQHEPLNHPDSLRFYKAADEVVRNAAFIFRGEFLAEKAVKGKPAWDDNHTVIVIKQIKALAACPDTAPQAASAPLSTMRCP